MKSNDWKKMEEFGLDVSALPDYTNNTGEIIVNLIAGAPTLSRLNAQTGIKAGSTERLNILDTDVTWSTANCVDSETGDNTTLVPRDITVVRLTDREEYCIDDLDAKLPMIMPPGARNEELPFGDLLIDYKVRKNSFQLEKLVWQGDTAGAGNLAVTDGFLKLIAADTGNLAYEAVYGAGDLTGVANFAAEPIAVMDLIAENRTPELYEAADVMVTMSLPNYTLLQKALRDAGFIQGTGSYTDAGEENRQGAQMSIYPGTNIMVQGTHGMNGSDEIVCTYWANLRYGTDLESDREDVSLEFSSYHEKLVAKLKFAMGFQYQDPSQIIWIS